jgi:ABC-type uncharacterized transport system auxiliary subunit
VIDAALLDSFERSGCFRAVTHSGEGMDDRWILALDVRDYEVVYPDHLPHPTQVQAHVRFAAHLTHTRRTGVQTILIDKTAQSPNHIAPIVSAFNQATQAALEELLERVLEATGAGGV